MSLNAEKAKSLFLEGYNCAQAVFVTFAEDYGLSRESALKLSSSFGGGLGRMREVCGAVLGMAMALGLAEGYTSCEDKDEHYKKVQSLVKQFSEENNGYICRELTSTGRTKNCADFVYSAAEILDNYLHSKKN